MSTYTDTISGAVDRVSRHDSTLKMIYLVNQQHTDSEIAELVDCLLAHPNVVTHIFLIHNQLTDETGIKLAQYISISSTIEWMNLCNNQFGLATYLALAAALRVNSSLRELYLYNEQIDKVCTEAAFVDALILNPNRPINSEWGLYSLNDFDVFEQCKRAAEELGHPNMQALLAAQFIRVT